MYKKWDWGALKTRKIEGKRKLKEKLTGPKVDEITRDKSLCISLSSTQSGTSGFKAGTSKSESEEVKIQEVIARTAVGLKGNLYDEGPKITKTITYPWTHEHEIFINPIP